MQSFRDDHCGLPAPAGQAIIDFDETICPESSESQTRGGVDELTRRGVAIVMEVQMPRSIDPARMDCPACR